MVKKEQTKTNSSSWEDSVHLEDCALQITREYESVLFCIGYLGKF